MLGFVNSLMVRHSLTLVTGLFECLCFSGAVFGWASLVFLLKTEGYFSSLCVNSTGVNATQVLDCSGQDEQFSLVFTIASFLFSFLMLPNGVLFDRFGTTVARLFGISLYTSGTLMVAFSTAALSNLLFPALALMAAGGNMFLLTNLQVGILFGSHRSTVITLYNGSIGSASVLFLVIKLLHEAGIFLLPSFLFLSACSIIHLLRTFFLLPRDQIPYPLPNDYTYGITCGKSNPLSLEQITAEVYTQPTTEDVKDISVDQEKSLRECLRSRLFWWHLLWLSVMLLRHYLYIGTLNPMLQRLTAGDPSLVSWYTNAFAITQLCGVLCAPWNGLIFDRNKGKPRAEVCVVLSLCLHPLPAASVLHICPRGDQPLFPLWRQRSLHQCCFPIVPLWEAIWSGPGSIFSVFPAAVCLLCTGEWTSSWRPFICEHWCDAAHLARLHPSSLCVPALSKSRLPASNQCLLIMFVK
ncbi:equilibrative nucleobase transporter 1-like isoform X2 [Eleginops maclovinus]|uniref:equilibrative nucleobase transporter 1-like isoform X2 n=1 Tax=Eleginops maclovinus TaxID=56733 RepID=UPI0030810689